MTETVFDWFNLALVGYGCVVSTLVLFATWGRPHPLMSKWAVRAINFSSAAAMGALTLFVGARVFSFESPVSVFWARRAVWPVYILFALVYTLALITPPDEVVLDEGQSESLRKAIGNL